MIDSQFCDAVQESVSRYIKVYYTSWEANIIEADQTAWKHT